MKEKLDWHSPDEGGSWLFMVAHYVVTSALWLTLFIGGIALLAHFHAGRGAVILWMLLLFAWVGRASGTVQNSDGTLSWRGYFR